MNISLALIVKADDNEAKRLNTCLNSVKGIFDEVCITITGENKECEDVCKKHGAKVSHFTWNNNFSDARNFNFAQATGDWIVWLDADDILRGGSSLKKNIELADTNGVTGLSFLYHYSHDSEGVVEDSHWKLQAVKRGYYEWRGIIHEDLLPVKLTRNASISDVVRVHTATKRDSEASLKRNLTILLDAIKKEPNEPRHYFYIARCYLGVEDWENTIKSVQKYLTLSAWKEERYEALNMMGEAYMRLGDNDSALRVHSDAILELEDAPDAYIYKARNYVQKEEWLNALTNLDIAERRSTDNVVLKRDALYDHDMYIFFAIALMQIGEFQKAKDYAQRAYDNRKTPHAKDILELASTMLKDEELTLMYRKIGEHIFDDKERAQCLLQSIPEQIQHDPRILALRFGVTEPKKWKYGSVAIYCGSSAEAWDGNSIRNGGIGGSETAVIEIAKRLVANGKEVVVYNRCNAPANGTVIDGVTYKDYWQFDKRDEFDVLWVWRSPGLADYDIRARKHIVDMHDVSSDAVFTPERLAKIDHVFVKTEYHKSLYPSVPDEKFVIIGNGIDLSRFTDTQKETARIIYTSTPNRGLENILDMWGEIRKKVKGATLHVFYGWNTFAEMNKSNPVAMQWMRTMQDKLKQDGVVMHGRVNQTELAKEMGKSQVWLYPTEFAEIHCITALEMQAARVYPITSGYAALAETQKSGLKIAGDPKNKNTQDKYIKEVVYAIENPDTLNKEIEDGVAYAKSCSWDNVTNKWESVLWNTAQ